MTRHFSPDWLQRRNILVVPREVKQNIDNSRKVGDKQLDVLGKSPKSEIDKRTEKLIKSLIEAEKHGEPIIPATRAEIGNQFRFDMPGGPRDYWLYTAHPLEPDLYLPANTFEQHLITQRYWEALYLLAALGATLIRIEATREAKKELEIGIPTISFDGGALSIRVNRTIEETETYVIEASLPGHGRPEVPDDLLWFPFEEQWQTIAEIRRRYGLNAFSLEISRREDARTTAEVAALVEGLGFNAGGSFGKFEEVGLTLSGEFAPLDSPAPQPKPSVSEEALVR